MSDKLETLVKIWLGLIIFGCVSRVGWTLVPEGHSLLTTALLWASVVSFGIAMGIYGAFILLAALLFVRERFLSKREGGRS